ncbi:MAG: hypothetical protein H6816_07045 [Phycisphaerales bacterium]|nr:hypothetical protein [Phycisphaerales bacterium]
MPYELQQPGGVGIAIRSVRPGGNGLEANATEEELGKGNCGTVRDDSRRRQTPVKPCDSLQHRGRRPGRHRGRSAKGKDPLRHHGRGFEKLNIARGLPEPLRS